MLKPIHQQIKSEVKEYNRARRIESNLSLDQPIRIEENAESIGDTFFQAPGDFVNSVMFRDFLNGLERELKIISLMYIEKYTSKEIMQIRNISKNKLAYQKKRICDIFMLYDPLIILK